ncbi:GAF domain-containing protein [Nocardia sp. NBC_01503]|uniref:GAF domain-containing protein n=1 Tax=Nocardia sp. NBC_01503 TaxID=2975997 RepID=UPI002E7B1B15|nr:GAF domain-containing protein [Nocardia sp. NBC_01503]WTL31734.1 GAF domain-containing protein [Nocardia sp. NBC_01503]
MPQNPDIRAEVEREWQEYSAERERAARSAAIAAKYEVQELHPPVSMQPFRQRMAELHRRIEARHLACARLHRLHARRLERWSAEGRSTHRPVFMAAVAQQLGVDSAVITLFGPDGQELLVAASDSTARAAHDLEMTLGEGPARDVLDGNEFVVVTAPGLLERWPRFGPAVSELGVRAVIAVPLPSVSLIGSMCVYANRTELRAALAPATGRIADALANAMLLAPDRTDPDGMSLRGALFEDADYLSAVHQAAGRVAVQCECDTGAALALLRARAFAEGTTIQDIARRVLEDGYNLR